MHNQGRFCQRIREGPLTVDCEWQRLGEGHLNTASIPFDYMLVGVNAEEMAQRWAAQIHETLNEHGCATHTLSIDRADTLMIRSLEDL